MDSRGDESLGRYLRLVMNVAEAVKELPLIEITG